MANIGFNGLGIMGAPMAGHLINDGHTLFTNTVGQTPSALVEAGARVCLVGGSEAAFEKVKPLFQKMGKNITLVDGNGDGQITKVANQIIVALTIEAVGEALLLAAKAGADPARVREALMGGFANSRILEVHGERMVKRTFAPGFRIDLHRKDLNLALTTGRQLGPFRDGARAGDHVELRDRPTNANVTRTSRVGAGRPPYEP